MRLEIMRHLFQGGLSYDRLASFKITGAHHRESESCRCGLGLGPCLIGCRIEALCDGAEPLPRGPAGILQAHLTRVTDAFAAGLAGNAVLHDPTSGVAAQPQPEPGKLVVPDNMVGLALGERQSGESGFGELHGEYHW
jgi:hypothetical protein